jgi:hypothetical protein
VLLPFDVGVRRLAIDRRDVQKAWQALSLKMQRRRAQRTAVPARSERLTTLFEARQRTRAERGERSGPVEPLEPSAIDRASDTPPAAPPADRSPKSPDAIGTTSNLLEKKRARRK